MMARRGTSWLERDFDSILDDFRRSFDAMMHPYYPIEARIQEIGSMPVHYAPLDFIDDGDHYLIHIELPGFTKEDVDVQINRDGLTLRANEEIKKETKRRIISPVRERILHLNGRYHSRRMSIRQSRGNNEERYSRTKGKEEGGSAEVKPGKIELKKPLPGSQFFKMSINQVFI